MLTDPREIEIISKARQKNVRDPLRSRKHFDHIFHDFLVGQVNFQSKNLLDLGPGQYDFGELARQYNAETYGIDNDPAVIELGRYKGFQVVSGRLQDIRQDLFDLEFDGVFCKLSINAFWFADDDQAHRNHIQHIVRLLKPDGWAWIAPWNGIPKKIEQPAEKVQEVLNVQMSTFQQLGFVGIELTEGLAKKYGVHGITANRPLYLYNLRIPEHLKDCRRLW